MENTNFDSEMYYFEGKEIISIFDPTPDQVKDWINALNNKDRSYFFLQHEEISEFTIWGGKEDRVAFYFEQNQYQSYWGKLIDPELQNSDEEIELILGEKTEVLPLYLTVPKQHAIDVLNHFLIHHTFPKNLMWAGRMDKFE